MEDLLPIERAYLEAVQVRANDPEAALARLEALVAVFGGAPDASLTVLQQKASERCLGLAEKQLEQLSETVKEFNQEQRQAIRKQLERADKLAASDRPAAEQVWRRNRYALCGRELGQRPGEAGPGTTDSCQ